MNLENLGLVELNAQEIQETEGGWYHALATAIALIGAADWIYGQVSYGWNNSQ